jgi:hypothetical protein
VSIHNFSAVGLGYKPLEDKRGLVNTAIKSKLWSNQEFAVNSACSSSFIMEIMDL